MNDNSREQPLDTVIDRIVDGSLCPSELGVALARIEREADGWKRCTLAFLEAQCWREAFRALDAPAESQQASEFHSVEKPPATSGRSAARGWRSAAAAAFFVAAFALGWLSHVSKLPERVSAVVPVAAKSIPASLADDSSTKAKTPASALPALPDGAESLVADNRSLPDQAEMVRAVAQVRIGPDGAGATVPILAGPGIDGEWLKAQPPPLSEYEQVALQRLGYQVDQRRRILVGTLADGRPVTVPIDQIEIRYTGTNPL